jgi:hypothetical protein
MTERLNLYVKNKIWYDASTDLAKIHDSPQTWLKLLEAIDSDLKPLAKVPIAGSAVPITESKLYQIRLLETTNGYDDTRLQSE